MRKSKFSESKIVGILKDAESGIAVADLTRKRGVSKATFFKSRSKYGGAMVSDVNRLRELEAENAKLKRMYADLALENAAIKDVLNRNKRSIGRPSTASSRWSDAFGYLAYDAHAADLLFQVVSRRYEQKSIVITKNLPFRQWDTVFPNAACAVALIDRLTHHAEIISIDGESYRKRAAEQVEKRKQEQKPKR
jgi:putative transposase